MERIVQFQRLLEETMVWCASQNWDVNPATGLRTALLRPSEQASVEQTFSDYGKFWKKTVQQRQQVVEQLAIKRAELLQDQNVKSLHSKQALTGGRLLAFDPLETTSDGGAWQATQGFFDYNSVPAAASSPVTSMTINTEPSCSKPSAIQGQLVAWGN